MCVCALSLETANTFAMKAVYESVHIVKCYEIKWIHGKNHLIKIDTFIIADIIYSFVHGFWSISTQYMTKNNADTTYVIEMKMLA